VRWYLVGLQFGDLFFGFSRGGLALCGARAGLNRERLGLVLLRLGVDELLEDVGV
jgi:hypothetical protein